MQVTYKKGHEKKNKKQQVAQSLLEWAIAIFIGLLISLFVFQVLLVNALVPTESMETTIMTGDRVVGLRLSYAGKEPGRGDIILFRYPDDESQLYVKRVIGLPGDEVEIHDGLVYVNGSDVPLAEDYLNELPTGSFGPYQVPEDGYFVMGDNRNHSWDSRYWKNTYVKKNQVVGRAAFRVFPTPTSLG